MTRILTDIPDEDIHWLDEEAKRQGKSRAAVLREAVSSYKAETAQDKSARKVLLASVRAAGAAKALAGETAARSQDSLFTDNGMPG